jgi:hypothetical protein
MTSIDRPAENDTSDEFGEPVEPLTEAPVPLDAAFEVPVADALEQHQSVPDDDDAWEHE